MVQWEARLKREGLASLDGTYKHKSKIVCYAIPDRVRYGVHSQAYLFEFFSRAEEFARTRKPKWPTVWNLFAQGMSYRAIGRRLGISMSMAHRRIDTMRGDMRDYFAAQSHKHAEETQQTDILEIFVEQQRKG